MKLNKFHILIFKTTWKSYFKNIEKISWKFTKKTWKNHGKIMEFCQSEKVGILNKFAYLYSKPLGNHTLKIIKKIPENLLKNLEKWWNFVSLKKWEPCMINWTCSAKQSSNQSKEQENGHCPYFSLTIMILNLFIIKMSDIFER